MTGLFAVGLGAVKVMDCRHDVIAFRFVGADRIYLMANHLQRLKRHHGFVIFGVIANQHQDLLAHLSSPLSIKMIKI